MAIPPAILGHSEKMAVDESQQAKGDISKDEAILTLNTRYNDRPPYQPEPTTATRPGENCWPIMQKST